MAQSVMPKSVSASGGLVSTGYFHNVNVLGMERDSCGPLALDGSVGGRGPLKYTPKALYFHSCKPCPVGRVAFRGYQSELDSLLYGLGAYRFGFTEDSAYIGHTAFPVVGYVGAGFTEIHSFILFQVPRYTPSCRSSSSQLSCGTDGSLSPCRFQSTCRALPAVHRRGVCG